jgi:hypothetical protein
MPWGAVQSAPWGAQSTPRLGARQCSSPTPQAGGGGRVNLSSGCREAAPAPCREKLGPHHARGKLEFFQTVDKVAGKLRDTAEIHEDYGAFRRFGLAGDRRFLSSKTSASRGALNSPRATARPSASSMARCLPVNNKSAGMSGRHATSQLTHKHSPYSGFESHSLRQLHLTKHSLPARQCAKNFNKHRY